MSPDSLEMRLGDCQKRDDERHERCDVRIDGLERKMSNAEIEIATLKGKFAGAYTLLLILAAGGSVIGAITSIVALMRAG